MRMQDDIIRIGLPIINKTNLYPMVKPQSTQISSIKTIQKDGVEVWNISFTSLDCTYVESVRHIASQCGECKTYRQRRASSYGDFRREACW
jgi:hypothetical protein